MSSVKPSRKIFFLLIACLIGVGAIGFAVYATNVRSEARKDVSIDGGTQAARAIEQTLRDNAGVDSDSDNLQNWEEVLWGTDANNPDTDKDGARDGDEVNANRNPLKPGPEDKLTDLDETTKTKAIIDVETDKTKTGELSRELFSNYFAAKRLGLGIDVNTQQKIIAETFSDKNFEPTYKTFTIADVKVASESDFEKYGNDLGLAFFAGKTDNTISEANIVLEALNESNAQALNKLDPIIAGYSAILTGLTQIYVPKELTGQHVQILNGVNRVITDIKSMKQILSDPLVGLGGVSAYSKDTEYLRASLVNVRIILDQHKIKYTNTEYGYVFMKIAQ